MQTLDDKIFELKCDLDHARKELCDAVIREDAQQIHALKVTVQFQEKEWLRALAMKAVSQ